MASELYLSNDSAGWTYAEENFPIVPFVSETSALAASATLRPVVGPMPKNGTIVGFNIGVATPALSASGFVSGTITADVRINSAVCCSTSPAIAMAGSAGQAVRTNTITGGALVTSTVLNTASTVFSAGDMISIDYNARSVGSAAAGAAATGLYANVRVRYATS